MNPGQRSRPVRWGAAAALLCLVAPSAWAKSDWELFEPKGGITVGVGYEQFTGHTFDWAMPLSIDGCLPIAENWEVTGSFELMGMRQYGPPHGLFGLRPRVGFRYLPGVGGVPSLSP